jgi:hypothetical protein
MPLPALSERLSPDRVSGMVLCARGILIAAAVPLGLLDLHNLPAHVAADAARLDARIAKKQTESDKSRAEAEAHFKTLTPDSPLEEYVATFIPRMRTTLSALSRSLARDSSNRATPMRSGAR